MTPLGASALQDQPAGFGGHSRPEPMGFCAAPIIRLKGSLRHSYKFSRLKKRVRLAFRKTSVKKGVLNLRPMWPERSGLGMRHYAGTFPEKKHFRLITYSPDISSVVFYNCTHLATRRPSVLVSELIPT